MNLATAVRAIQLAPDYRALEITFPPWLQVALGLAWGGAFLWAAWRLWRLRNGSVRWVLVLVGVYGLVQIVWWRVFARADYALRRWPFAALGTVLLVALLAWYLRRPPVRALFRVQGSVMHRAASSADEAEGPPAEDLASTPGELDQEQ